MKDQEEIYRSCAMLILISIATLYGCIERFYPEEEELNTGTIVVVAQMNNIPGDQSISLSRSTTLNYPEFDPLSGCYVEISRADGQSRAFRESDPGEYHIDLDGQFLLLEEHYKLTFITPAGDLYESDFEQMLPAPAIDSVYYIREDHPTSNPGVVEEGIQFYADFEIEKDFGRHLRWQLTETYEIHNPEYKAMIFDVDRKMKDLPDSSSWRTCWITKDIPVIYTMDLLNVDGKTYREMPLNFVSNKTRRLNIRYSLLVRQFALTRSAFWYWNELGNNLQSKGDLFETLPSITPSNIYNLNDEKEKVIGYFSISGASEKRIFVEEVPDLRIVENPYYCAPGAYPPFLYFFPQQFLPIYLTTARIDGVLKTGQVNKECVDCREYKGSSNIKPDFW